MKNLFPGYYRPTQEQFQQMWKECIFIFDTNILLNLYRYTANTREELFNILELIKERTWLPHQAMLEYLENREEVIAQQYSISSDVESALETALETIEEKYRRGHPFVNTTLISKQIKTAINKIKTLIAIAEARYPKLLENDELSERIAKIFNGRVGNGYPPEKLENIYKEFEQRFKLQIPPGYKDKKTKREGFKRYGDGILWFQVIDYAKSQKKPIILVTDDQKEDWWRIEQGKTLGPRPELINEMSAKAKAEFYMYNASQFLKYAKEFLGLQIKQESINEAKEVGEQNAEERSYRSSDILRRALQAEDSVYEWMNSYYIEDVVEQYSSNIGINFVLLKANSDKIGVIVKYRSKEFFTADIREIINRLLRSSKPLKFDGLLIILVCGTPRDAAVTFARLKQPTQIPFPKNSIVIVGMLGEHSVFRPTGTLQW